MREREEEEEEEGVAEVHVRVGPAEEEEETGTTLWTPRGDASWDRRLYDGACSCPCS